MNAPIKLSEIRRKVHAFNMHFHIDGQPPVVPAELDALIAIAEAALAVRAAEERRLGRDPHPCAPSDIAIGALIMCTAGVVP